MILDFASVVIAGWCCH